MSLKVLSIYNSMKGYPGGKAAFSMLFGLKAPYFLTIRPSVEELREGYAEVTMKQRWSVQNHIKTVHAIAVCNLVEMCMGLVVEATILNHLRWLPMGMNIDYKKKAIGKLTALSIVDAKQFFILPKYPGVVEVPVDVKNEENTIVTTAQVRLWITEKPKQ